MLDNRKNFIISVAVLLVFSGLVLMNIHNIPELHYCDSVINMMQINGAIFIFAGLFFFTRRNKGL